MEEKINMTDQYETRNGLRVTILDNNGCQEDRPVIAEIFEGGTSFLFKFTPYGRFLNEKTTYIFDIVKANDNTIGGTHEKH